ncbi:MAG TPA: hypothetical protein PLN36_01460 [Bacteroidales bacterium]|nr:hypothetical protein [Bacteroidales bacterium]HRU33955.1 hypothetical protein [Bacteroidales bacterium]
MQPSPDGSSFHFEDDVKEILDFFTPEEWDLIIAHPPCTRLCNSGVQWLAKRNLWAEMREGAEFFKFFMDLNCEHIAIENPIPHKYALEIIGRKYDQLIQPWQFGEPYSKATCLWLKNLPRLVPTEIVPPERREQYCHRLPPSSERSNLRSITYRGIAEGMASQWSPLLD